MFFVWWLVGCVVAGCVFTAISIRHARARLERPAQVRETGVVLVPAFHPGGPTPVRYVGAGVLFGKLGKVTASWPLVVLEVVGSDLTVRIRPRLLAGAFGARPLHATAKSEAVAFPARSWFGSSYVGIRTDHGEGYFRTSARAAVLGMLQSAGFTVSWAEQKLTYF